MAAVLATGRDGVASHLTALALHGLGRFPVLPHLTVPPSSSARTRQARIHRSEVAGRDRAVVDDVPCTSVSRAIAESAGWVSLDLLADLVDAALCDGLASATSVLAALDRMGRTVRGAGAVRHALAVWTEGIEPGSPAEVRFLRRLVEWGVTDAVAQYEIVDGAGRFVARVDAASPSLRVVFEYDGDRWHGPRRWASDEGRQRGIEGEGWTVLRVTKLDLLPSSTRVPDALARIRRCS